MASLYEINQGFYECVDEETGEIIDEAKLQKLQMAEDEKIKNIALWIKNLKSEAEALKQEKLTFEKRQKVAENKAESLSKYLATYLDGRKIKDTDFEIGWRKSEQIVIDDESLVPEEYLKISTSVDKTKLKAALKNGEVVFGAEIVTKNNMQIK